MRPLIASTLLTASLLCAAPAFADHYEFDKDHTTILFHVNHIGFSDMIGKFSAFNGSFDFDPAAPEKSKIDVTIDPAGIRTSSTKLDSELQNDKFFNTAKFPSIHFVSVSVTKTGDNTGDVIGNVTLLGVTKPVTLHVHFNKGDYHPMTKMFTAGFSADASFKRSDFGMNAFIPMVGDDVRIEIQTEGTDMDRKKAEEIKH
jgi:polyisoprenoid-binding protein YceI